MTQVFNVLSPDLDIHNNYLIEASAGTGKTFSIENIVVRLLLEPPHLELDEILVVTFTKAAASDLKTRVRANIEKALHELIHAHGADHLKLPYLQHIIDDAEDARLKAIKRLEQALFCFDQAQIFTIHGFCSRMLSENIFEADIDLASSSQEEMMNVTEMRRIIRNFLRSEVTGDRYCAKQIELLQNNRHGDSEQLEKKLLNAINRGLDILERPDFDALFRRYGEVLTELKSKYAFSAEQLVEDFELQKGAYREINSSHLDAVRRFGERLSREDISRGDFEALIEEGLVYAAVFDPSKIKAREKPPAEEELHYPYLREMLCHSLKPIIDEARSPAAILVRMARDCRKLLQKYCLEEERVSFDDLLKRMHSALENEDFVSNVKHKYRLAIIDEFQDTDPLQWEIFNRLFLSESDRNGSLYLVGDPKQSIYSFRQADIYTYLSAADRLGRDAHATLDTNFRSEKGLIDGLNALFCEESCPGLITLPKTGSCLPYLPVKAGASIVPHPFADGFANIHFFIGEMELKRVNSSFLEEMEQCQFFPFIAQEIQKLHIEEGFSYNSFAVLVAHRYQAERLGDYLDGYSIPYSLQRNRSLANSPALGAMREMLAAAIDPADESLLKIALAGKLVRYDASMILALEDPLHYEEVLSVLYTLHHLLFREGFTAFYEGLMTTVWKHHAPATLRETLLAAGDLFSFYEEFQHIAEILMTHECLHRPSPDNILAYLDEFPIFDERDDPLLKKRKDPSRDAVKLITIHSSKGLEYEIVFALGAITRPKAPDQLVPDEIEGRRALVACIDKNEPAYVRYCHELDAEKMRQLYVAMTRAKHRLYLPAALVPKSKVELGLASSMELFLARLGQPAIPADTLYSRIVGCDGSDLMAFIAKHPSLFTATRLKEAAFSIAKSTKQLSTVLLEPKNIDVPGLDLYMQSFSSLSKKRLDNAQHGSMECAPRSYLNPHQTAHTLPAGSETGTLLHLILEEMPFATGSIETFVAGYTKNSSFEQWTACIASIIENTLNTSIDGIPIKDICDHQTVREMEFLHPVDGWSPCLDEVSYQQGYIKGVIDLICRIGDKYYIIDWKSNWLGPSPEDYNQENLRAAMAEHNYFLQGALYRDALRRYLAAFDSRPFEEIFGGVYYLFLRGLSICNEKGYGIFRI